MKVEMDMPDLPDGWEYTGEYRTAMEGEWVVAERVTGLHIFKFWGDSQERTTQYAIVRRKHSSYGNLNPGDFFRFSDDPDDAVRVLVGPGPGWLDIKAKPYDMRFPPSDHQLIRLKATFEDA